MLLQTSRSRHEGLLGITLLHAGDAKASTNPAFAGIFHQQLQLASGPVKTLNAQGTDALSQISQVVTAAGATQTAAAAQTAALQSSLAKSVPASGSAQANPRQLQMTPDDFSKLTQGLSKLGFSDKEIADLQTRIGTDQGLTWGQFGVAVRDKISGRSATNAFAPDEKQNLASLLNKLGFAPLDAQKAVDELPLSGPQAALAPLVQGAPQASESSTQKKSLGNNYADALLGGANTNFWAALSDKMAAASQDQTATVSQEEFASLSKALSLPSQVQDSVSKLFAASGGKDVSLSQIKDALAALREQSSQTGTSSADAVASFKQALNQTMDTALERAANLAKSSTLPNPTPDQADAKEYRREAVRTVEKTMSSFQSAQDDHKAAPSAASSAQAQAKGAQPQQATPAGSQNTAPGANKAQVNEANLPNPPGSQSQSGSQNPGEELAQNFSQNQGKNPGFDAKSGGELLAKAAQKIENSTLGSIKSDFQGLVAQQQTTTSEGTALPTASAGAENFSRADVLQQIENGMLRNLGQGTKQLTLELTPENLGKLNIVLQVRNSELTATIKSDNAATTHILNQNLAELKESFEKQGLTVTKLDVQTNLADGGMASNWNGSDTHNDSQGQRETMRQSLLSAKLGQLGPDGLAQDMQSMGSEARISHAGLDLFA